MTRMTTEERMVAQARAATCRSCKSWSESVPADRAPCIGCGVAPTPASCVPGNCPTCAHDPRWVSLDTVLP